MGDFLFSFFKELNSATNKNMIALAVVLGIISGFLPTFTPINYLIFLIVLIFRIPVGLYTASFGVFSLFSYLFDPLFNNIGYVVLTHFKPFWTFLYNLPLLRWSGYNNTLVMGSLIAGIVTGGVFYVFLVRAIDKYRKTLFLKIKNIKILSWIVPSEEKKGIFRLSGIAASIIVIGGVFLTIVLFLDPLVKSILSFTLSKSFHKKVYIQEVKTKIFSPSIEIKNMSIDSFLIKNIYVKMNMKNLLWRKYDIEKMVFDAKTNYSVVKLFEKRKKENAYKTSFNLPKINLPSPGEILNSPDIKSFEAVKKLQKDYSKLEKFYKLQDINKYKSKIEEVKKDIKSLKNLKINSLNDIAAAKEKFLKIQKEVELLNKELESNLNKLKEYKNLILQDIKEVKKALKEDYKSIENQYSLLKEGKLIEFSKIYLKPEISRYVDIVYDVFEKIKPYLKKEEKKEAIILRRGIYIKYEDKIKYPDFVIRYSKGNLKTSIADYRIILENISGNQHLLGKSATLLAFGESRFYNAQFKASYYDFIQFLGFAKNIKLKKVKLEDLTFYHPVVNVEFKGRFKESLVLFSKIRFNSVDLKYTKNDNISNILNQIFKNINNFEIDVYIKDKNLKISSNLDKIVSDAFFKIYKSEIERRKRKTIDLLNKKINSELSKYNIKKVDKEIKTLEDAKSYLKQLLENAKKELIKKEKDNIKNKILKKLKLF